MLHGPSRATHVFLCICVIASCLLHRHMYQHRNTVLPNLQPQPLTTVIAHSGRFWWTDDYGPNWQRTCIWQGQPLACDFVSIAHSPGNTTAQLLLARAAAMVHHMCWDSSSLLEQYRNIPQVMFSMESDAVSLCINQRAAHIEMSYRSCAQAGQEARIGCACISIAAQFV